MTQASFSPFHLVGCLVPTEHGGVCLCGLGGRTFVLVFSSMRSLMRANAEGLVDFDMPVRISDVEGFLRAAPVDVLIAFDVAREADRGISFEELSPHALLAELLLAKGRPSSRPRGAAS